MRTSTGTYMYSILYCTQPSILDFDTPEETATGTSTSTQLGVECQVGVAKWGNPETS